MSESKVVEDAIRHFQVEKCNCAESVLWALAENIGEKTKQIPRIATAFGAGIAGQGEVCGALVGAVMALGLKFGRDCEDDLEAKALTYAKVQELYQAFQEKFDSIRCIDLVGFSMLTPEGKAKANELDLHNKVCPAFVSFAAETAYRLIIE